MKSIRKYLSLQIIAIIIVFTVCTSYMSVPVKALAADDAYQALGDLIEVIGADGDVTPEMVRRAFYKCITQDMGFITANLTVQQSEWLRKGWANLLNQIYGSNDKTKDNLTSEDYKKLAQYITQNTTLNEGDRSVTYNNNSKNALNLCVNQMINDTGFTYVYSLSTQYNLNSFPSGNLYNALRQKLNEIQTGKLCTLCANYINGSYKYTLLCYDISNIGLVYNSVGTGSMAGLDKTNVYDLNSWNRVEYSNIQNYCTFYLFNESNNTFESTDNKPPMAANYTPFFSPVNNYSGYEGITNSYASAWNSDGVHTFKMYRTLTDLKSDSVGESPYYYNNTVYNNWSTSSGDYTVSVDNSNQVTYGDITSYVNSFNTENQRYPTPTEIEDYIIDYEPSGSGGSGSGGDGGQGGSGGSGGSGGTGGNATANATASFNAIGGHASANNEGINITINNNHSLNLGLGTVSGNGSGDTVSGNGTGTVGNIFGWLGSIGETIGNLIKGLGDALVGIFEGLADAITTILGSIPNIFTPLIEYVFGGLPDEIKAVITLGITAIITVGVIRAIKK